MVFHAKITACLDYFVHGRIMPIVHFLEGYVVNFIYEHFIAKLKLLFVLLTKHLNVTLSISYMNILLQNKDCFLWVIYCFLFVCLFVCCCFFIYLFSFLHFILYIYTYFWQIANYSLQIIFHKVLVL